MKKITLLLLSLAFSTVTYAQHRNCATMDHFNDQKKNDPTIQQNVDAIEAYTSKKILSNKSSKVANEIITIPVVVHVIYRTSSQNISEAQILSQIDVLNEDFRRTNSDADNKWSVAADSQIQFALATVDPNGNSTTGITRKMSSVSEWGTDDDMKKSSKGGVNPWNTSEYLNMWVCNIGGGYLGYAQFPGGDTETDGIVMCPQYFGSSDKGNNFYLSAPFDKGRTTTHEIGHFFNLRHIWGDGDCSDDDYVSDTPSSDNPNFGCSEGHNSCGSEDMVENYMDYSDDACMNLFTQGQKDRMRAVLESGGARRSLALSNKFGEDNSSEEAIACTSTVNSFPYNDSFESNIDWNQPTNDDGNWLRHQGGTPSSSTGPSAGANGSYYLYLESSSGTSANKIGSNAAAVLESDCFDLSNQSTATFSFSNHMYGSNIGSLKIEASINGSSWSTLWSDSGNQGNQWNNVTVDLDDYTGENSVRIRFVGTTGNGHTSDIAIDNISLTTAENETVDQVSCATNGANLALDGAIASYTSQQSSTNGATNLIDGNDSNRWSAQGYPQSVVIDLGQKQAINAINLIPHDSRGYQFKIEGSDSASSGFSTLVDATNNASSSSTIEKNFSTKTVRYVKLTVTGASGYTGSWVSIKELEILCAGNSDSKLASEEDKFKTTDVVEVTTFPNPFTEKITVKSENGGQQIGSIQLVDLTGRTIISQTTNGNEAIISNLDGITSGFYFLSVFDTNNELIKVVKVMKN